VLGEERIAPIVRAFHRVCFGEEPTLHQLPVHVYSPVFGTTLSLLFDFHSVVHTRIILGFLLPSCSWEEIIHHFLSSHPVLVHQEVQGGVGCFTCSFAGFHMAWCQRSIHANCMLYLLSQEIHQLGLCHGVVHTLIILGFLSSEDFVSYSCCWLLVGLDEEPLGIFPLPDPLLCGLPIEEDSNKLIPRGVAKHFLENDVDGGVAHTPIILGFLESWEQRETPRVG
jgi:hypothetical protein